MMQNHMNLHNLASLRARPISVLIAEDHVLVAEAMSCMLERNGIHRCDRVHDALQAKAALLANPDYDIVLLDLNMPGMAGLASVAELVQLAGETPVMLVTADDQIRVDAAFVAGVKGVAFKHNPISEIRKAMVKVLSGHRYVPCPVADAIMTFGTEITSRAQPRRQGAVQHIRRGHG